MDSKENSTNKETHRYCKRCKQTYAIEYFPIVRMHYDIGGPQYQYRRRICRDCYHQQVMASDSKLKQSGRWPIDEKERLAYIKKLFKEREKRIEKKKRLNNYNIIEHIS